MLNTLAIFEDLSRHLDRQAARKIAEILGQVYEEVAETVNKKEFNELKEIVGDLAQAQNRTEKRLAQLAKAQEKTERSLNRLIQDHRQTRERLESMSDAVGYNLENQSCKGLPPLFNVHHPDRHKKDLLKIESGISAGSWTVSEGGC